MRIERPEVRARTVVKVNPGNLLHINYVTLAHNSLRVGEDRGRGSTDDSGLSARSSAAIYFRSFKQERYEGFWIEERLVLAGEQGRPHGGSREY